jgi:hypothetical protein
MQLNLVRMVQPGHELEAIGVVSFGCCTLLRSGTSRSMKNKRLIPKSIILWMCEDFWSEARCYHSRVAPAYSGLEITLNRPEEPAFYRIYPQVP